MKDLQDQNLKADVQKTILRSLNFDEKEGNSMISNISELRDQLKTAMEDTLKHFEDVDRTIEGFEGLELAQQKINTDEKKDAFAKDYKFLSNIWESLSRLCQIFLLCMVQALT